MIPKRPCRREVVKTTSRPRRRGVYVMSQHVRARVYITIYTDTTVLRFIYDAFTRTSSFLVRMWHDGCGPVARSRLLSAREVQARTCVVNRKRGNKRRIGIADETNALYYRHVCVAERQEQHHVPRDL